MSNLIDDLNENENAEPFDTIISLLVYSDLSVEKSQEKPWLRNPKLKRRREAYLFDRSIQGLIDYVERIGDYTAGVIDCGPTMSRAELKNCDGCCIHIFENFYPGSKYVKNYLALNWDMDNAKYGFFKYSLEDGLLKKLEFVVPNKDGDILPEYTQNITGRFIKRKDELKSTKDIEARIETIRIRGKTASGEEVK